MSKKKLTKINIDLLLNGRWSLAPKSKIISKRKAKCWTRFSFQFFKTKCKMDPLPLKSKSSNLENSSKFCNSFRIIAKLRFRYLGVTSIGANANLRTKTSKTLCLDFGSINNALSDPWRHKHSKMSRFWKSLEQAWINGVLWSKSIWSKLAPYWINIWTDLKLLLLTASINGVDPVGFNWFGSCFPNFRRTSNIFGSLMPWKIAGLSKLSSRSQPNSHKVFTEKKENLF